jgi:hypothetical protein
MSPSVQWDFRSVLSEVLSDSNKSQGSAEVGLKVTRWWWGTVLPFIYVRLSFTSIVK